MTHDPISRRAFIRRTAPLGAALIGGPVILTACGGDDGDTTTSGNTLEQAQEAGFIRVGFANEAPYGFADESGNVTGEAPEVAKAVLAELGIDEINGVVTEFGSLIPGLNAGRFDIVAAGMFVNAERCAEVLFSDPDYCAPQALAVQAGNPKGLSDYESVRDEGATLGVLSGAVEETHAQEVGIENVETLADTPSLIDAVRGGRVDAFALTSFTVNWQIKDQDDLEATEPFIHTVDGEEQLGCGAYAFRQDDEELRDEFNRVLKEMLEAGEVAPIVEPFGFGETEIDLALETSAEELCEG